jgi:hypothetical protein
MKKINFYKMSGSGNDFIIIDNRDRVIDEKNLKNFVANVCRRKMSVLILSGNSLIPTEAGPRCVETGPGVLPGLHI